MNISLMTLGHVPFSGSQEALTTAYQQFAAEGFSALDISSMEFDGFGEAGVAAALQQSGLQMSCYLCFTPLFSVDETIFQSGIQLGLEGLQRCHRLGCNMMMAVPILGLTPEGMPANEVPAGVSRTALSDRLIAGLQALVPSAQALGITIAVEDDPHREVPLCSIPEMTRILETVPEIGLIYDTANMLTAGEEPLNYFDTFRDRIVHLHLKEAVYQTSELQECFFGTGQIPFAEVFRRLRQIGFHGYMAYENGCATTRKAGLAYLKEIALA